MRRIAMDYLWDLATATHLSLLILGALPWWMLVPVAVFAQDAFNTATAQQQTQIAGLRKDLTAQGFSIAVIERNQTDILVALATIETKVDAHSDAHDKEHQQHQSFTIGNALQWLAAAGVLGLGGERLVARRRSH